MAYNALNNLIDAYIYANGVQAITGQILNGVLKQMVAQLGSGYHLMGVATPQTVPATDDYAMAYFAATAGEYTNFGGITLAAGEVAVLLTSGNGSWSKQTIYNIPTGTADLENTAEFITNSVTDLVNYYTKTEVDDTLANYPTLEALATALADYYTKTEIDTILADYTTNTALASALADYYNKNDIDGLLSVVNAALADRYTKDETDTKLADYYKKTETYDKDEVDSIVATLSRQEYIVAWDGSSAPDVTAIPAGVTVTYSGTTYTGTLAASASTVNKIYMVWNGTAYDMYGTSQDGGYSWVPMGTTTVDLSQYATKAELSQLEAEVGNKSSHTERVDFVPTSWTATTGINLSDGTQTGLTSCSSSSAVDISEYAGQEMHYSRVKGTSSVFNYFAGIAFYDSDGVFISAEKCLGGEAEDGFVDSAIIIPANAKTARFTFRTAEMSDFYAYVDAQVYTYTSGLGKRVQDAETNINTLDGRVSTLEGEKINKFVYTKNDRENTAIKEIYIDVSGYTGGYALTGLKLVYFGYYSDGNAIYFQLKNGNDDLIGSYTGVYDSTFPGYVLTTMSGIVVYISCNWEEYVNHTPHQVTTVILTDSCFVKSSIIDGAIVTAKIADEAVTTAKIANGNVTSPKIADGAIELKKLNPSLVTGITNDVTGNAVKTAGYYWDVYSNLAQPGTGWNYYTLDLTNIDSITVTAYAGISARLWLLFDADNNRISYSSDSSAVGEKTETVSIPSNASYAIINSRQDTQEEIDAFSVIASERVINGEKVGINGVTAKEYIDGRQNESNILYGKTLVCVGDSITRGADMDAEGIVQESPITVYKSNGSGVFTKQTSNFLKTYGYQIAERNRMTFYNGGIDGSTMQGLADKNGFSLADGRYTKLPDNLDYLTIFFGWNDDAFGTLGTINDSTNGSYYGGYNVVMPYLINKYPYAKIALIVPFGTDEGHRNAIRELANKWGIACFDMYQGGTPLYYGKEPSVGVDASIVTANRAKFQANGAHPNFAGHRQIGDMLEHFLRGI